MGTVAVGNNPHALAIDPSTRTIYVADAARLHIIDGHTLQETTSIPLSTSAIAVDPTTHQVYATTDSGLSVLDGTTGQTVTTLSLNPAPTGLALDRTSRLLYTSAPGQGPPYSEAAPAGSVIDVVDTKANQVRLQLPIYVFGVAVDPNTHALFAVQGGPKYPSSWSVLMLNNTTGQILSERGADYSIGGIAIDPNTDRLLVARNDGNVYLVATNSAQAFGNGPLGQIQAGTTSGDSSTAVAVDPSTQIAYVTNAADNSISTVDENAVKVLATVRVGPDPPANPIIRESEAVAVDPITHMVYVAEPDDNTVVALQGPTQSASVPHDARYSAPTGYRIDNDTIWDYFTRRGGLATFGYPTSRTFTFQGFTVQFFQRRIVQLGPDGQARLLNLLDAGLLPYTSFNGSTFPGVGPSLVATAPDPTNQGAVLAWVQEHAPDTVAGAPTNFDATFASTVSAQVAFPTGGDASLLPGIDLELRGIPTSGALVDPNNHNFITLRWQRGIMLYDASCHCTQGVLLADYLKAILTGQHLPADLAQEAASSPLLQQYDPSQPHWVHNPSLLPSTDMTNAFQPE